MSVHDLSEPFKKLRVVIKVWVCMSCLSPLKTSRLPARYQCYLTNSLEALTLLTTSGLSVK